MRGQAADEIKARLTMHQVAGFYGYEPNRSGFLRCPFHSGDRQASLRVYSERGGWHCFGCGKGGSVIDFVMELFDLSFPQACIRLNRDFGLRLPVGGEELSYQDKRRLEETARKRRQEQKEYRLSEERELLLILQYRIGWIALCNIQEEQWTPLEIKCIRDLPWLEEQIDTMTDKRWENGNESFAWMQSKNEDPKMTRLFLERCANEQK